MGPVFLFHDFFQGPIFLASHRLQGREGKYRITWCGQAHLPQMWTAGGTSHPSTVTIETGSWTATAKLQQRARGKRWPAAASPRRSLPPAQRVAWISPRGPHTTACFSFKATTERFICLKKEEARILTPYCCNWSVDCSLMVATYEVV